MIRKRKNKESNKNLFFCCSGTYCSQISIEIQQICPTAGQEFTFLEERIQNKQTIVNRNKELKIQIKRDDEHGRHL
jgi:2-oxoglutarate dehydrogenase complex dehydrogenase (E1) component-like enzyme